MILERPSTRSRTIPTLVLRIYPPRDKVTNPNVTQSRKGIITERFRPVSLSCRPLPEGRTLTTRVRSEGSYAYSSEAESICEELVGWILSLEARQVVNRKAIKQTLFIGRLASDGRQFDTSENGVDLYWNDADLIKERPLQRWISLSTIGFVLSTLDADETIWPTDGSGNRLASIDSNLFSLPEWTGMTALEGQYIAQAFPDLLQNKRKMIPVLDYSDDGTMVLTAVERGAKQLTLISGRIESLPGTPLYQNEIKSKRGVKDFSSMTTRITGQGDYIRKVNTVAMTPAWDRSLDAAVLADPTLPDVDIRYRDVGKTFSIPGIWYPYNAEAQNGVVGKEAVTIWGRKNEFSPWMRMMVTSDYTFSTSGGDNTFMRRGNSGVESGAYKFITFQQVMYVDWYTDDQLQQMADGNPQIPERSFWSMEFTGIEKGSFLVADTGYVGDYPVKKWRIHRNRDYSKLEVGQYWREIADGREAAVPRDLYDHTGALLKDINDMADQTSMPKCSETVQLNYTPFFIEHGMEIAKVYDTHGTQTLDRPKWFIEDWEWKFNLGPKDKDTFTTTLNLSNTLTNGGVDLR